MMKLFEIKLMHRILYIVLIFIVTFSFYGCSVFDDNMSHPDEGGINLGIDWSRTANQSPSVYQARVVAPSGAIRDFSNLSGTNNLLVVSPGEGVLYVYNEAEHVSVFGKSVKVNNVQTPGMFYSYSSPVFTERNKDINHSAIMIQQTGELRISFAIKPQSMISRIRNISAVLEGVSTGLDMQTNVLSSPASVNISFTKSTYYATALLRVLGFDRSSRQNLKLEIEFENGNIASTASDLTSLLSDFNESRNTVFSLNADLNVSSETSVTVGRWKSNTELNYLSVSPSEINWERQASNATIEVVTDQPSWSYSVNTTGNWLTVTKSDAQLMISASENWSSLRREATINISAGGLNESVTIIQNQVLSSTYLDKETVVLQRATVGNGVNIILMGEGYTQRDMNRGTGKYERDMRKAADAFFSVYPYTIYRNHFNVYMIAAISNQEGISNESTNTIIDTRFEALWEGGRSTGIDCNDDIVVEYLDAIADLATANIHDLTVIMPINANIYAGTCIMSYEYSFRTDYGNGFSISMCPTGSDFEAVVMHEAGGHGFAKLTDEYIYNTNETIPDDMKDRINLVKRFGWYENVDLYSDITLTTWSGFAGLSKYSMVSTFEGADLYGKGIWRPEYNSCMNNNVSYFNAPSRWAQVRRIKRLAGISYTFSRFLQDDVVPAYPTTTRQSTGKGFVPLAPPVIKDFSKTRK